MPDPIRIFEAQAVTALLAAAIVLLGAWVKRWNREVPASIPTLAGIAVGLLAGCWLLGLVPHWPPREDQDRFLLIVLPAVIAVEMLAALASGWVKGVWLLRQVVAVGADACPPLPLHLFESVVRHRQSRMGHGEAGLILAALAACLAGTWGSLLLLCIDHPADQFHWQSRWPVRQPPLSSCSQATRAADSSVS